VASRVVLPKNAQEKYVASGGLDCPYCGSSDIEGDEVDIGVGWASQGIVCKSCGQEWFDQYKLSGFEPKS
jgi:transposase-like protein